MRQELQNKLFEKYPVLFSNKDLTVYESPMAWGICCGDGWYDLIESLCHIISTYNETAVEKVKAVQVKNKFGGLRFYVNTQGNEHVQHAIRMAEALSFHICQDCGDCFSYPGWRHETDNCTRCNRLWAAEQKRIFGDHWEELTE